MTSAESGADMSPLLDYIKRTRGFDFTGYKSSTILRRVQKRMLSVGIDDVAAYVDYLEVHPDEFSHLFNTILINVTGFFRDESAWQYIGAEILPQIIAARRPGENIRIWCAGCASGEEAYTLAMMLAELLGLNEYRDRVKIYATDADEEALNHARQATYTEKEVAAVPDALLRKYFDRAGAQYVFPKDLRRNVIFGRHDLMQDAPISRVDLLTCRNTLMYFNLETQGRILSRFHFALNESGFLFLGKAEMPFALANAFQPVDVRRRVFRKIPRAGGRERMTFNTNAANEESANRLANHIRMRGAAFEASTVAQIVLDDVGRIAMANDRARSLFGVAVRDLGRPLQDLEVSYRPVELRSLIEQAQTERRTVFVKEAPYSGLGGNLLLDIQIHVLHDPAGAFVGTLISFTDVTRYYKLQDDLHEANQELEAAYEELQSTSEELETTNEELQSTNEELETTNEELQSSNEELETMNEELQSTNEELQAINDELRQRSEDLNVANGFLSSVLRGMRGGVIVVDRDLRVTAWNPRSEELWGLRAAEVQGKHLLNLDIGLPLERLRKPIREALSGDTEIIEQIEDARNRRGQPIKCRVTCTPLDGERDGVHGVILVAEDMDEADGAT